MYLKQIKNSIKLNFFKKLFLLTLGIVFFTIIIGFFLNFLFFDKFYIYRNKQNILSIKNEVLKSLNNSENFSTLRNSIDEIYGIKVDLRSFKKIRKGKMMMHHFNTFSSLKIGESVFTIKESENTPGVMFLRYNERLPNNKLLTLRTSLSVMKEHLHELLFFNIFIALISLIFSSIFTFLFSKKVTKNITQLKISAQQIARLEHPKDIIIHSNDEFQDLSYNLEKMSKNLLFSINNLKLFVSNASHELKTPISVLCLYSQALARDKVKEEDKKSYYKILLKKSLEMRSLTESLLTLSKINSIDYKISKNKYNVKDIISNSVDTYDYLEFEKNITIDLNISDFFINIDINLFSIAINNLVQNLFKYASEDSQCEIFSNENYMYFENEFINEITHKDSLFEPFSRGENAIENSIEGSGLGLSIVKRILELHKLHYFLNLENDKFKFIIYFNKEKNLRN